MSSNFNRSEMSNKKARRRHNSLLHNVIGNADNNNKIVNEALSNPLFQLTSADYALICRALSDSMNYKPTVDYEAKWQLLLKVKSYQLRYEDIELKGANNLISGGDNNA